MRYRAQRRGYECAYRPRLARDNGAPGVALVEKGFETLRQLLAVPHLHTLNKPKRTGGRRQCNCAVKIAEAGASQTHPGAQLGFVFVRFGQLDLYQQSVRNALKDDFVVVLKQSQLPFVAIQPTGKECLQLIARRPALF